LEDKPIKMLLRIKEMMTRTEKTNHESSNLLHTLREFVLCTQKEDESLKDYRQRMQGRITALECVLGKEAFKEFTMKTERYKNCSTSKEQQECLDNAFTEFTSVAILRNADKKRYGGAVKKCDQEYALTHLSYDLRDKFPRSHEDTYTCLMKHEVEVPSIKKKLDGVVHLQKKMTFKGDCYVCGKKDDHRSFECPRRWDPKEKWARPEKWQEFPPPKEAEDAKKEQSDDNKKEEEKSEEQSRAIVPFNGQQIGRYTGETMSDWADMSSWALG